LLALCQRCWVHDCGTQVYVMHGGGTKASSTLWKHCSTEPRT
ncbi:hypothetical protein T02_4801, partial [Trichinella nativa]